VNLVESGDIILMFKDTDLPIAQRNYDNEKYIKAACYRLGWGPAPDRINNCGLNYMPMFAHISDLHGDIRRFDNCAEYANILGVDAIINTGDSVLCVSENGSLWQKDVVDKHNIKLITCIGNHEVYSIVSGQQALVSQQDIMDRFITPYITDNEYKKDAYTNADNAYYYVDFSGKNIRVITLNQYDNGCYWGEGNGGRLGQSQLTWLVNTLLSTPQGYGVVIAMHSNEAKINTPDEMKAWNQTVNSDGRDEDVYGYCVNGLYANSSRPIRRIVDAFIERDAEFDMTYNENNRTGNNGETVHVTADFSTVASDVEFICYLTGHRHKDNIGYVDNTRNMQLILNVVCGNPCYERSSELSFSGDCDLPRGDRGATQDAFNIYVIDRQNGRVKIARVGSNVNFDGVERKFLIAKYRDTTSYDISANNEDAEYSSLDEALGTNGANIPTNYRTGGLIVRYIDATSHQYVSYRLDSKYWSYDSSDWEAV
jgi:3',5'-cyclic AMP phosphodiesterase CpdA